MILISTLRETVAEMVSAIPEIKHNKFVFNESQLTDKLSKIKSKDEIILLTVCPQYNGFDGVDSDSSGYTTYFQFFILSKIDNKTTQEEDIVSDLQPIAKRFLKEIEKLKEKGCDTFDNVEHGTIEVKSIINLSQCCGWIITFSDDRYTTISGDYGLD